ncbi:MAG: beta-propeller domain-containing protein [Burkholderiales bacterium]
MSLLCLVLLPAGATAPKGTLRPFASEAELKALLLSWADRYQTRRAEQMLGSLQSAPAAAPAAKAAAESAADSITNVQHAGVDEGGIVKLHGEHLVILRRGRLFTVEVDGLRPVSAVDAFGPAIDPRGAWYDEMLIWQDSVVVIGYSYARGGTEVALFDLSPAGELSYRSTHHLRSNDYYSSRNYASRLIGSKLVFYTPLYLNPGRADPFAQFPAARRWPEEFKRIAPASRIYRADEALDPSQGIALHSVSICELAQRDLACESTAVLGPAGRVFYVSPESVFVWAANSSLFRIPLDGSAPSALRVSGTPIDQFSFLEGADGFLNVLVRSGGRGEAMWSAEFNAGAALALLRVPLASFSGGRDSAPRSSYRGLPGVAGYAPQNRFVAEYLLYGGGAGWRRPQNMDDPRAFAVRYARPEMAHEIVLEHGVDRIEGLGNDAVLVGSDGRNLHFTSLRLGRVPSAAGHYVRANASQGETRSHGFFYNAADGLLGLPIIGAGKSAARQLRRESASVLFLSNQQLKLTEVGALGSRPGGTNDGCRASCVDWYGNSRPLFLKGRVLALMGYELVEGELRGGRIHELRRADFTPALAFLRH